LSEDINLAEMRVIAAIDIAERAMALAIRVAWIGAIALILAIVALVR
jgi:hypothetical protein